MIDTVANMAKNSLESASDDQQLPTSSGASEMLNSLDADRPMRAEQMPRTWWYHTSRGLIVVVFVLAQVAPTALGMTLIVLGILARFLLVATYSRRYGISLTQPAGKRSSRVLWWAVGIVVIAMAGALLVRASQVSLWWALALAAGAFAATVVLGRHYDSVLRVEIAQEQPNR